MFVTFKGGRVDNISTDRMPGKECTEVSNDWHGSRGDLLIWFDSNMRRIPDHILVEQGKRVDCRGKFFNKNTREEKTIAELDEVIADAENWTRERPLDNESHKYFDEASGKWLIDMKQKDRVEKEAAIASIQAQIEKAERKIIRPLRAINKGRATEEDINILGRYDSLIKNDLRPEKKRLEMELKTA